MTPSSELFGKRRLTPGQLRAVSEYRFRDAICLLESPETARATGATYMGGFVIECLLKALLLERHANLQQPIDPGRLSPSDRKVYGLLYGHELDEMLSYLPEVQRKLQRVADTKGRPVWPAFQTVCEQWTVYVRYSPKLARRDQARRFIETVSEVKQWLRDL